MSMVPTSYRDQKVWRSFNEALPAAVRMPQTVQPDETNFQWSDGLIHVDRFPNEASPVRVVLHHGVGTNARMMSIVLGHHLAAQGFDVSAVDMPYFGATACPSSRVLYCDWVAIGAHYVQAVLPDDGRPVVLFGFSAGGMLSYHIACVSDRVAAICGTCFLDMRDAAVRRDIAPMPRLNGTIEAVGKLAAGVIPDLRLPLRAVSNMRALTNDAAMTRLLLSDPGSAGVNLPLVFLQSFLDYAPAIPPENFERCSIFMLHPGQDRWTPVADSMRFIDRVKAPTLVTMIDGAGHLPITTDALMQLRQGVTHYIRDEISGWQVGPLESAA